MAGTFSAREAEAEVSIPVDTDSQSVLPTQKTSVDKQKSTPCGEHSDDERSNDSEVDHDDADHDDAEADLGNSSGHHGSTDSDAAHSRDIANGQDNADSDGERAHTKSNWSEDDSGCTAEAGAADEQISDSKDSAQDAELDHPTLLSQFDYYSDSDHYLNLTTTSLATAPFHGFMVSLRRDWVQASDLSGAEAAEMTVLAFNEEFSEFWGIGGGFGQARSLDGNDPVGSIQSHLNFGGASLTGTIAHDLLAESAQSLRANVRRTDLGLSFSDDLSEHLSTELELHHKTYSDHNTSNELEFSPQYKFDVWASQLALGYRFNYIGFSQNTENGYWAPERSLSNGLAGNWTFDWNRIFGRGELGLGYDLLRQSGASNGPAGSGIDLSASMALGIRPIPGTELQFYLSTEQSAGWNSIASGLSLKYTF